MWWLSFRRGDVVTIEASSLIHARMRDYRTTGRSRHQHGPVRMAVSAMREVPPSSDRPIAARAGGVVRAANALMRRAIYVVAWLFNFGFAGQPCRCTRASCRCPARSCRESQPALCARASCRRSVPAPARRAQSRPPVKNISICEQFCTYGRPHDRIQSMQPHAHIVRLDPGLHLPIPRRPRSPCEIFSGLVELV
jgi:hypothetical protein